MSLYFETASIIKKVDDKKGSIKTLVFQSSLKNKKALYALVCETLKFRDALVKIVENARLLKLEKALRDDTTLATVLLYDHIMGKGVSGNLKACIQRHRSAIHSECERLKVRHGVTNLKQIGQNGPSQAASLPKYVRVNTIKTDIHTVVSYFQSDGWRQIPCDNNSFKSVASSLELGTFCMDPHVPDLLIFPPRTDFHLDRLYLAGEIILQDKASCLPAHILLPPEGAHVIDCCAAPGNKTSHLAAIMANSGKIFAFDKDPKRLKTLTNLTGKAGAKCIEAECRDFLSVDPLDPKYADVEYVLVDPSCTGSGMVNRMNEHTDDQRSVSKDRIHQLSRFQISILKHAFKFPRVCKVVYSTCSVHEEENEYVVAEVLNHVGKQFEIVPVMPDWPDRGVGGHEHAQSCLRMSHDKALTNGFFVACFEKIEKCNGEIQHNVKRKKKKKAADVIDNDYSLTEKDYIDKDEATGKEGEITTNNHMNLEGNKHTKHKHKKAKRDKDSDTTISDNTMSAEMESEDKPGDLVKSHTKKKSKNKIAANEMDQQCEVDKISVNILVCDNDVVRHTKYRKKKKKIHDDDTDLVSTESADGNDKETKGIDSKCEEYVIDKRKHHKKKKRKLEHESTEATVLDNEIDERHKNKKKKRKSEHQPQETDTNQHAESNHKRKNNGEETKPGNACKKKRKKSKDREFSN